MTHQEPNDAINDFENELRACTLRTPDPPVACGRPYVQVSKLIMWLGSEVVLPKYRTTQASRLLEYAYHDWRGHAWPITREKLFDGEHRCILVFCILLKLQWGDLVHVFRRVQSVDKHLPIPLSTLQGIFRQIRREDLRRPPPNPDELAAAFDREQWQFCPAKFDLEDCPDFHRNRIIPILKKAKINDKGGTATLWQIEVLQEFVDKKLQEVVKTSLYNIDEDHYGPRYHFALKVFNEGNRGICDNEIEAFTALREHSGMVRYLGGYNHQEHVMLPATAVTGERKTKATHNILLEYGDRDLDELFWERLPPVLQNEIEAFWKGLFEIADAVEGIHNFKIDNDGIIKEYFGWHADIKPDNILEIQGKLKLADPGFARFREKASEQPGSNAPTVNLSGGTHAFGAPERYPGRRGSNAVPQTIDIWSLGCVFSITATWVALGPQGILQYIKLREGAINSRIVAQQSRRAMKPECPKLESGDFFHDGLNVLSEVTEWHKYLRSSLRRTDTMTSEVLDLVDNYMLVGNPKSRMKASELCDRLSQISGGKASQPSIPENILEFLLAVDENIPAKPIDSKSSADTITRPSQTLNSQNGRQAKKSKYLAMSAMKTVGRSYLKSTFSNPADADDQNNVEVTNPAVPAVSAVSDSRRVQGNQSGFFVAQDLNHVEQPGGNVVVGNNTTSPAPSPGSLMSSTTGLTEFPTRPKPSMSQPQNVFQACEELERGKNKIASMFGVRSKWKDPNLARYFKNRDIRFLVDNAESMDQHWGQVKHLLVTLVRKAGNLDDDGVDLSFTLGTVKAEHVKDESKIVKKMCDTNAMPRAGAYTDIRVQLMEILDHYLLDAKRRHQQNSPFKNMTILVLTDGIWQNTGDKEDVNRLIINFAESLAKIKGRPLIGGDRPVSIEFIQFGRDSDATLRLKRLDDELVFDGAPDLVDTEHCTGDVNKMLLGSFVEAYDALEDTEDPMSSSSSIGPTSPNPQSPYEGSQRMSQMIPNSFTPTSESPRTSPHGQEPFQTPNTPTRRPTGQAGQDYMVNGVSQIPQHRNSVKSSRSSRFSFNH